MLGALFGFKGRLSRPGFWEVLASIFLIDVALLVGRMFVEVSGLPGGYGLRSPLVAGVTHGIPWVLVILTVWSLLAATVKRCHDRGRTGALVLVALIPVIGWLWLLVDLFVLPGSKGKNRYGRAPHGPAADEASAIRWGAKPSFPPQVYYGSSDAHAGRPPQMDAPPPHVDPDHDNDTSVGQAQAPHDEGASEAAHSEEGHGAGHHRAPDHGHQVQMSHDHIHDGGGGAASHASAHVTVAHAH